MTGLLNVVVYKSAFLLEKLFSRMKDKSENDSVPAKKRKSVSTRKRKNSGKSISERESQEKIVETHEEEGNKAVGESDIQSPRIKRKKDTSDNALKTIKSEDTTSQDEDLNIEESLFFEVEKTEVERTPTKDLRTLLDNIKEENELQKLACNPQDTPYSKRSMRKTRTQTLNITPVSQRKQHPTGENDTPSRKERKISLASDYDQLSDTVKSELYNVTNFNELEPIDMIHDLDTVMHFEDIQVNQENLMSPNGTKITERLGSPDGLADPAEDPLYISNDERKNSKITSKKLRKAKYLTKKLQAIKYIKLGKPSKKCISKHSNVKVCLKPQVERKIRKTQKKSSEKKIELPDDIEEALQDLEIKLIHEVPPQHKIEKTGGSTLLTFHERQLFETYGPLRKGVYSPIEDETIKQNWMSFCKVHHWDPHDVEPFLYRRHGNRYYIKSVENRIKFVQFMANGLPWRTLYSVYQRFRKLYEKQEKTSRRYTEQEDKVILSYVEKNNDEKATGKKFSDLAKLLHRTRQSIWMRYHRLQKSEKPAKNIVWTKPLIANFIKHLINATLSEDVTELKDATIPKPVWLKVEDKLKIDEDVLKTFWMDQLHMQLFSPHTIYLNDIKIQLIEYIYGKGISSTREIIWPNVAKYFEGITSVFLCKIFFHLVREITVKTPNLEFADIIEYLYKKKIPEIREEPTDKYLPRLKYKNDSVEVMEEQTDDHSDIE